jgi:hypothetical protein
MNPNASWPTDPAEALQVQEMMFAAIDKALKEGELREFGCFPNGRSGCATDTGEAKDEFARAFSFYPFIEIDVQEIVPWETAKETMRGIMKAQAEQMAAMKR